MRNSSIKEMAEYLTWTALRNLFSEIASQSAGIQVITLASGEGSPFGRLGRSFVPQLRFWSGEPHRIHKSHVDSCGRHLLTNRCGIYSYSELEGLAQAIIPLIEELSPLNGKFARGVENDVVVWRRSPDETVLSEEVAESPKS